MAYKIIDAAIRACDEKHYLREVKIAAEALHISPEDLEDRGMERGITAIGSKKTGAIVAKYNQRTGKLILTGHSTN